MSWLLSSLSVRIRHCAFIASCAFLFILDSLLSKESKKVRTKRVTSRLLLKDHPLSVTPFLLMLDPDLTEPWDYVSAWFQNDDPTPFFTAHGRTIWDYGCHEPRFNNFFNEAMASDARLVTSVLIKECKGAFEGLNSFVDVGGGTGTVAKTIVEAFPHLHSTVLDLPHVVADLQGSKNLTYLAGDMFEAIPPADAILLKVQPKFSSLFIFKNICSGY